MTGGPTADSDQRSPTYTKRRVDAPPGFFAVEAAGLQWLADAKGVPVVEPLSVGIEELVLPRLPEVPPSRAGAEQFGRLLAATHSAGAAGFGTPPEGWDGDGYIGPLVLPHRPGTEWGAWFAEFRVLPYLRAALDAGNLDVEDAHDIGTLLDLLVDPGTGLAGPPESPARLHGDLWNGNILWTADGVVLIDPAAHGGHRETDLAMLSLFGLPYLADVLSAYREQWPLSAEWQRRVGVHQLHPLLVHATLFGGGYGRRAGDLARAMA